MKNYTLAEIQEATQIGGSAGLYFLSPNVMSKRVLVDGAPAIITRPHYRYDANGKLESVEMAWRYERPWID